MESYMNLAYKLTKFLSFAELKSRLMAMGVIFDMKIRSKPMLKRLYLLSLKKPNRVAFIRNKLELDAKKQLDASLLECAINFSSTKKKLSLSAKKCGKRFLGVKIHKRLSFNSPNQNRFKKGFKYYELCKYLGESNFHKTISLRNSNVKLSLYHLNTKLKKNHHREAMTAQKQCTLFKISRIPIKTQVAHPANSNHISPYNNSITSQTFLQDNKTSSLHNSLYTRKYKSWVLMNKEGKLKSFIKSNIKAELNPSYTTTYNSELIVSLLLAAIIIAILLLLHARPI